MNPDNSKIAIYEAENGNFQIDVRLDKETVWLNVYQFVTLFQRDRTVILRHIRNIYKTGELDRKATCAKNAQVQFEGKRQVVRNIEFYNLDMIISVGYRVNSIIGTQFRIWATKVLKEHIIKGYSINQKRLEELKKSIKLINAVVEKYSINTDEARALIRIVSDYTYALDLLDDYDYQRIKITSVKNYKVLEVKLKTTKIIKYYKRLTVDGLPRHSW